MSYLSEGDFKIWCPRIFISSDIKSLFQDSSSSILSENNISSLFTASALENSNQSKSTLRSG